MNYMLQRDGQQYGPYTLADLQRYVASGNILITDLVKSEGMEDWVPLSQVIGNIPVPVAPPQPATVTMSSVYPSPPDLHWGVLLALEIVTCGLFGAVWLLVQAVWARKVQPNAKALTYLIVAFSLSFVGGGMSTVHDVAPIGRLLQFGGWIMSLVGIFSLRSSIEEHFNSAEPIGLRLSGVMTFFFNAIYFQYHFNEIAQAKKAQQLSLSQHA